MALSATSAVVGQGGTILWGTTGTPIPTSGTASVSAFNDLGYLDEDGITLTVTPTIQEFNVWQSFTPIRRGLQTQNIALSGKFAEHNVNSIPKAFGGGTLASVTSGTYAFIDPSSTGLDEFSVVADVIDGSDKIRYCFARVNQTEAAEVTYNRQGLAVLPFNFGVLATTSGVPGTAYIANA